MSERFHLQLVGREEIGHDVDFPGRDELRSQIIEAQASGNADAVARLQQQHRRRRLAAMGGRSVNMPGGTSSRVVAPAAGRILRTATSVLALNGFDGRALLSGVLFCWGAVLTANLRDGSGAGLMDVQPSAVTRWLHEVDPLAVGLYVNHEDDRNPVGRFVSFEIASQGLLATCAIFGTPAGSLLLDAADRGDALFSAQFRILRSHRGEEVRGERVLVADEIAIVEGSLTPSPADMKAVVLTVRGVRAAWLRQQGAVDRDERLRKLWALS